MIHRAHLPGPLKQISFHPKYFSYLPKKKNFTHLKELIFYQKEKFLALNRKNNQFSKRKNFLYLSEKKQFSKWKKILIITNFPNKKFVVLVSKTNVLPLREKVKVLHAICVLNMALLSFLLVKPNRDFNKLSIRKKKSINQFLFVKQFYFCILYWFFCTHSVKKVRIRRFSGPYVPAFGLNTNQKNSKYRHFSRSATSLCFSSLGRFLYRSQPNSLIEIFFFIYPKNILILAWNKLISSNEKSSYTCLKKN